MNEYEFLLIKESESVELYAVQTKILNSQTEENLKVMQLALLQCKSPIENYERAIQLLKLKADGFEDIRIGIIGFYLSLLWSNNIDNVFRENMRLLYGQSSSYFQSLVEYLFALECYYSNDYNSTLVYLNKSIALCDQHVCNYMLMSKLCHTAEKKEFLKLAKNNIQTLSQCESAEFIPCPDDYIEEFVSGRTMPIDTFNSLTCKY